MNQFQILNSAYNKRERDWIKSNLKRERIQVNCKIPPQYKKELQAFAKSLRQKADRQKHIDLSRQFEAANPPP